jgi:hypothetical protein
MPAASRPEFRSARAQSATPVIPAGPGVGGALAFFGAAIHSAPRRKRKHFPRDILTIHQPRRVGMSSLMPGPMVEARCTRLR